MFCEKCGAPLEEGKQFCVNCGAKVDAPETPAPKAPKAPKAPREKKPIDFKNFKCPIKNLSVAALLPYAPKALGILLGVIIFIMGITVCAYDAPSIGVSEISYSSGVSFGGDFYTYMYDITESAVAELNNLASGMERMVNAMGRMTDAILSGIGSILMAIGMIVILVYALKPVEKKTCCCKKEEAPAPEAAEAPEAE